MSFLRTRRKFVLGTAAPEQGMVRLTNSGVIIDAPDTVPAQFTFVDRTDIAVSTVIESNTITVSGINAPTAISITGGTYDINNSGSFVSSAGLIDNDDTVRVRVTSSASHLTTVAAVLTIGGISDTFSVTTQSAPVQVSLLEADWQAGIAGPGVSWYHDFRTDSEVNAFRWSLSLGNNPNNADSGSRWPAATRITTDGVSGACMEIVRPAGAKETADWWRPLAPIVGTGNGRGSDDPAANGSLTVQSYAATQGGGQVQNWGHRSYYGHRDYHLTGVGAPNAFIGTEYYMRVCVKIDPRRIQGSNGSIDGGKLFYFTRTNNSATDQEIVTNSGILEGGRNMFSAYRSVSPPLRSDPPGTSVHGDQPGTEYGTVGDGVCRFDDNGGRRVNCWSWPTDGSWVTVLFHVRPGHDSGNDTLFAVYVAEDGDTEYTQIWNQPGVDLPFDSNNPFGHNAVICSIYHNGFNMTEFWQRYCQMIFSHDFIPCRQVYASGGSSALALACYGLAAGASVDFTTQTDFTEADLAWQSSFHHDERHGVIQLMGKPASITTAWKRQMYRVRDNTWGNELETGIFTASGHIYGSFTMDYETGDIFQALGNLNQSGLFRAQWRPYSTGVWGVAPVSGEMATAAVNDIPNGLVYHPHLWGRNDGGLVHLNQVLTAFWRRSNGAVSNVTHSSGTYGLYEGAGCYSPGLNAVFIGGGDGGQLLRVTPNSTVGGAPVLTAMGVPPIRIEGASHGGSAIGSIHPHPSSHNKLVILETNGSRVWTSPNGSTWTQVANHPFQTTMPRVVCSLRGGLGCFWAIGRAGNTHLSRLWRPAP